jgi:gluconate 2-dehydrogenase
MKPAILVCRRMFPEVLDRLGAHFEVEANQADDEWSRDELIERLQGKAGAFITSTNPIDATVISRCPQLRAVASISTGYTISTSPPVPPAACLPNAPDVLTETTADFGRC